MSFARKLHKRSIAPLEETVARAYKAWKEGLALERLQRDLPGASFTSVSLTLEQFLNMERYHNLAVKYEEFYGVSDEYEEKEKIHGKRTCPEGERCGREGFNYTDMRPIGNRRR